MGPRDRDGGGEGAGGREPRRGLDRDGDHERDPDRAPPGPLRLPAGPMLVALVGLLPVGLAAQALSPVAGLVWTQLFAFLLPAAALAARAGLRPAAALRLGRPPPGALGLAALAGGAAFLAGGAIMVLWARLLPAGFARTLDVARLLSRPGWELPVVLWAAAILAPLCEEVAFRGYLLTAFSQRLRPAAAVALSAALFGAMHLDLVRLPAVVFLGLLYGWLTWRSGSLWPAVLAHAVNNAAATALALNAGGARAPEAASSPASAPAALLVLLAALSALAPVLRAYHRTVPPAPASPALVPGERRPAWVTWALAAGAVALLLIALLQPSSGGVPPR